MKIDGFTIHFWYKRDGQNRPIITVCDLLDDDGSIISYGQAICSPKDNPNKEHGRDLAVQRAFMALYRAKLRGFSVGKDIYSIGSLTLDLKSYLANRNKYHLYESGKESKLK